MKREFKFKVYDNDTKQIGFVVDIEWFHEGMIRTVLYDTEDDFNIAAIGDNCELMQFTGFKDKNGVEIYEAIL